MTAILGTSEIRKNVHILIMNIIIHFKWPIRSSDTECISNAPGVPPVYICKYDRAHCGLFILDAKL